MHACFDGLRASAVKRSGIKQSAGLSNGGLKRTSGLKQGGPLRRTSGLSQGSGFKKPVYDRPSPLIVPVARVGVFSRIEGLGQANPKRQAVRSSELQLAFRTIACQNCGADDGTVCWAHSNWGEHGKAGAQKADDNRCASLCARCHSWLDQGRADGEIKRRMWDNAHRKSVCLLVDLNRWPDGVPVPDLPPVDPHAEAYRFLAYIDASLALVDLIRASPNAVLAKCLAGVKAKDAYPSAETHFEAGEVIKKWTQSQERKASSTTEPGKAIAP